MRICHQAKASITLMKQMDQSKRTLLLIFLQKDIAFCDKMSYN